VPEALEQQTPAAVVEEMSYANLSVDQIGGRQIR
jgi:hypothetical protein